MSAITQHFWKNVATPVTCAILAMLVASSCRRDPARRRDDFVTALGFTAFSGIAIQLHWLVIRLTPATLDGQLLSIDQRLGIDPNRFALWMYAQHHILFIALSVCYAVLALVIAAVWIIEQNHALRRALLVGASFCWFFYVLCPAVGPSYYSRGDTLNVVRNCFPSMHFTWSLLLALNTRSWLRWPLWVYAALVGISTVAIGQHYVIDLIASLPYTAAVQFLVSLHAVPANRKLEGGNRDTLPGIRGHADVNEA